jgi:hypothetical protein
MSPGQIPNWGTLPFVEDTSPPFLGFGQAFGQSSRLLTFSQPLAIFGLEMRYNQSPFLVPFSLTAAFFHDTNQVGTITRSFSSGTGARLFAATDPDAPFTSVLLTAPQASRGFLIADVRETAVPEPVSLGLFGLGLVGVLGYHLRHRRARRC